MKRIESILVFILLVMAGCGGGKQLTDDFITVDVTANYPHKELILQDFMDVEYIALETTDEFLNQGNVLAIGKKIIAVRNNFNDGNIFIYDRNGKAVRKINRRGGSGEEYTDIYGLILDEDNDEMYVNEWNKRKIIVYDLNGRFKRSLPYKEGIRYQEIYNYDKENLICNEQSTPRSDGQRKRLHYIVSKANGSIIKEIEIPYQQEKSLLIQYDAVRYTLHGYSSIIPHRGNLILTEPSSDTVFCYSPDHKMTPFIVRTPSIQSMNPEVFLLPSILTDRYYFMRSMKRESRGFLTNNLMYDSQAKALFEYTVYNNDFADKRTVNMDMGTMNDEIAFGYKLEAYALLEDYEKGQLKGKLKEVVAALDEDPNPVIMLVKYKK